MSENQNLKKLLLLPILGVIANVSASENFAHKCKDLGCNHQSIIKRKDCISPPRVGGIGRLGLGIPRKCSARHHSGVKVCHPVSPPKICIPPIVHPPVCIPPIVHPPVVCPPKVCILPIKPCLPKPPCVGHRVNHLVKHC
jgi:hypothetical protein